MVSFFQWERVKSSKLLVDFENKINCVSVDGFSGSKIFLFNLILIIKNKMLNINKK